MKGIHINWTPPWFEKRTGQYKMETYEQLVQLLSILYWKKIYGPIKLYTDKTGINFYEKSKFPFIELYDEIDVDTLEFIHEEINENIFWAGGKLFSIKEEKTPFVMLDLDLFVTDNIIDEFRNYDLVFSHYETLNAPVYPNPKDLITKVYNLPKYDWSLLPGNVSITYFGNEEFKKRYTKESIEYMTSFGENLNSLNDKYNSKMVFAEQRLLTCIASNMNIKYKPLINDIYNSKNDIQKYGINNELDFGEEPSWFNIGNSNLWNIPIHHTWGYKHLLINKGLKLLYIEQLQNIIKKEFPEYEKYLEDPINE